MPKYRLLAEHVARDGRILPAGTEVGDDTPEPWEDRPSTQMMGLDDAGKEEVNKLHQELYGHDAPSHLQEPDHVREHREEGEKYEKEAVEGEPVSEQQRLEYEALKKGETPPSPPPPGPGPQPSPTVRAAVTRGGSTSPSPGPATPQVDDENRRPRKPNEEQYPKG